MLNGEAADIAVSRTYRRKLKKRQNNIANLYFIVICILFFIILVFTANSLYLNYHYRKLQFLFLTLSNKLNSIQYDWEGMNGERSSLKSENMNLLTRIDQIIKQDQEIQQQMADMQAQLDELVRKNAELVEDNVSLQNSLKLAASVGIKPQSYSTFSGITNRGSVERGKYIGKFKGTAYTPSIEECGNDKGITDSGKPIMPGISLAVDTEFWPFGTVFYIKGLGYAVAMDTGSAIKGRNRFDFAVFDRDFARTLGQQEWDVFLVRMGTGKVGEIKFDFAEEDIE